MSQLSGSSQNFLEALFGVGETPFKMSIRAIAQSATMGAAFDRRAAELARRPVVAPRERGLAGGCATPRPDPGERGCPGSPEESGRPAESRARHHVAGAGKINLPGSRRPVAHVGPVVDVAVLEAEEKKETNPDTESYQIT